jgi:hypothetical protein
MSPFMCAVPPNNALQRTDSPVTPLAAQASRQTAGR